MQAADENGCPNVWAIAVADATGPGPRQLTALMDVISSCLLPDPDARLTTTQLITALTQLKNARRASFRLAPLGGGVVTSTYGDTAAPLVPMNSQATEAASAAAAATATATATAVPASAAVMGSPVPGQPAGASYDVLAIMDGMEAQGIDAGVIAAVGDAVGHLTISTLDVLKTCGVPALKVVAVKKMLAPQPADAHQVLLPRTSCAPLLLAHC
jgi:hypothetical protein